MARFNGAGPASPVPEPPPDRSPGYDSEFTPTAAWTIIIGVVVVFLISCVTGCDRIPPRPPVVEPAPGPADPTTPDMDPVIRELFDLHVQARDDQIVIHHQLMSAAQKHAEWMARNARMSHRGAGFSSPASRIKAEGYDWTTYGENVAYGQKTPEHVMQVWLKSPGHRRNIKSGAYREIGIGYATGSNSRIYWCVTFGSRGFASADQWDESWATPEFEESDDEP